MWIDDRGPLSVLRYLRDDMMQGDYRALYLALLKVMRLEATCYDE